MSAKKGRSGRKRNDYNKTISEITDQKLIPLLRQCPEKIQNFFNDPSVSTKDKADLAARFLLKMMPEKIEIPGGTIPVFQIVLEKKQTEMLSANNRLLESPECVLS